MYPDATLTLTYSLAASDAKPLIETLKNPAVPER
jgi:hypothetical protein